MEGWHPDGYPANLAYSPELWDWMTGLGLYLNFDPSHLLWLGHRPGRRGCARYVDRVLHVQAKDAEIDAGRPQPTTASSAMPSIGRIRGRAAGGATGSPDSGRSTGAGSIDTALRGGYDGVRLGRARGPGLERAVRSRFDTGSRSLGVRWRLSSSTAAACRSYPFCPSVKPSGRP